MLGGKKEVSGRLVTQHIKVSPPDQSVNSERYPALVEYRLTAKTAKKKTEQERESSVESKNHFLRARQKPLTTGDTDIKSKRSGLTKQSQKEKIKRSNELSLGGLSSKNHPNQQVHFLNVKRLKEGGVNKEKDSQSLICKTASKSTAQHQASGATTRRHLDTTIGKSSVAAVELKAHLQKKPKNSQKPKLSSHLNTEMISSSRSPSSRRPVSPSPVDSKNDPLLHPNKSPLVSRNLQNTTSREYDLKPSKRLFSKIQRNLQTSPSPSISSSSRGMLSSQRDTSDERRLRTDYSAVSARITSSGHHGLLSHPGNNFPPEMMSDNIKDKLKILFDKTKKLIETGTNKEEKIKRKKQKIQEFGSIIKTSSQKSQAVGNSLAEEEFTVRDLSNYKGKLAMSNIPVFASPNIVSKKRGAIKTKVACENKSATTKKKPPLFRPKKIELEKDKDRDNSTKRSKSKKKSRLLGAVCSKDHHPNPSSHEFNEASTAIISILRKTGVDKEHQYSRDKYKLGGGFSSLNSQIMSAGKRILPASSLKLDHGQLQQFAQNTHKVLQSTSDDTSGGGTSFRHVLNKKVTSATRASQLTECANKIQKQWRMYRYKQQHSPLVAPSTPSSANDNEPVCMKTSSGQSEEKETVVLPTRITPKQEIENRYRQFADENERKWRALLNSIEKIEVGTSTPGNESFIARLDEMRRKGDLCVKLLKGEDRAHVAISNKGVYLDLRNGMSAFVTSSSCARPMRTPVQIDRARRNSEDSEQPDPVASPDGIPNFSSSPSHVRAALFPKGHRSFQRDKWLTPSNKKPPQGIPPGTVSSLQFQSIEGMIPVPSNKSTLFYNPPFPVPINLPHLPIPSYSQGVSQTTSKPISTLPLPSSLYPIPLPRSPSVRSPRLYLEPYPQSIPPLFPQYPLMHMVFSPSSLGGRDRTEQASPSQQQYQRGERENSQAPPERLDRMFSPSVPSLLSSRSLHRSIERSRDRGTGGAGPGSPGKLIKDGVQARTLPGPSAAGHLMLIQGKNVAGSDREEKPPLGVNSTLKDELRQLAHSLGSKELAPETQGKMGLINQADSGWKYAVSVERNVKEDSSRLDRIISGVENKLEKYRELEEAEINKRKDDTSVAKDLSQKFDLAETRELKNYCLKPPQEVDDDSDKRLNLVGSFSQAYQSQEKPERDTIGRVEIEFSRDDAVQIIRTPSSERINSSVDSHHYKDGYGCLHKPTRLHYHANPNKNLHIYEVVYQPNLKGSVGLEGFGNPDSNSFKAENFASDRSISFHRSQSVVVDGDNKIKHYEVNSFREDENKEIKVESSEEIVVQKSRQERENILILSDEDEMDRKTSVVVLDAEPESGEAEAEVEQEALTENEEAVFATSNEKTDIITSFILEHLIIEAINEGFCLNKFIQILGPHLKHLDTLTVKKYIERLFNQLVTSSSNISGLFTGSPNFKASQSSIAVATTKKHNPNPKIKDYRPQPQSSFSPGSSSASACQNLLLTTTQNNQVYRNLSQIETRLNNPIGHTDLHRLLLASPLLPETEAESLAPFEYEPVLDIKLYIALEETLREGEYKEKTLDGFEMEKEHIVHKLIFDSLNECLDYKRRGGVGGGSLRFGMKYKDEKLFREDEVMGVLNKAKDEVLLWTTFKAGALMEKEPIFGYHGDAEGLEVCREKAMSLLIHEYVGFCLNPDQPH